MKKYITIGVIVAVLVTFLLLLVSCNQKPASKSKPKKGSGDVTLTYWRLWDDKEVFQPIIDDYQKEHKNIKIEYKKLTYPEYEKTLVDVLAAGRGPDLFSIQNTWLPRYFDKLAPIAEDKFSVNDYDRDFFKVAAQDNTKDKHIYGIPYSIDTLALFSNSDLLNKADIADPPDTWEKLIGKTGDPNNPGLLPKLNNRQGNTFNQSAIALGNGGVNRPADILALMMLQQRTNMVNDTKDRALFNLTQPAEQGKEVHLGTNALKFYTSFADPRTTSYSWNASLGDSIQAFTQGKTALLIGYAYMIPTIERLNPNLQYRVTPVPQIAGQDPVNYASYWTEVVSKASSHQGEAWDFIRYVSSKENLSTYNQASKTVSSRKTGGSGVGGSYDVFYQQNETAQSWYKGDAAKADEIFVTMINQVLAGEDPQRAIDKAANSETSALADLKNLGGK